MNLPFSFRNWWLVSFGRGQKRHYMAEIGACFHRLLGGRGLAAAPYAWRFTSAGGENNCLPLKLREREITFVLLTTMAATTYCSHRLQAKLLGDLNSLG